jgi:hypothetical protein
MSTPRPGDDAGSNGLRDGSDGDGSGDSDDLVSEVSRRAGTERIEAACWAIAARDCALECGDSAAAALFAGEARDAIGAVLATGVTAAELADELSYPGGHTEMDGPHIDRDLTHLHGTDLPGTDRDGTDPAGAGGPAGADDAVAVGASPAAGLVAAGAVAADGEDVDAARRDQLTRWHHDDHTSHTATQHDTDELVDDTAGDGGEDPWVW